MKILKKSLPLIIFALVTIFATSLSHAEEKEYIVYLSEEVSLFSTDGRDYALLSEDELSEALSLGVVDFYEENVIVELHDADIELLETENSEEVLDPKQDQYKWEMDLVNAYYPREKGYFGEGVTVAVIDSGCSSHLELSENVLPGYNMIDNTTDVTDNIGHGTKVIGVIAAEINTIGISGVAPKCKIVPIKAFEVNYKTKVDIISQAIIRAVDDFSADVINLSLGSKTETVTLKNAVDYAISKGVIIVASSGNYENDDDKEKEIYQYPASFKNVVSVGAVDINKVICDYSYHNDAVTVVAPGGTDANPIITLSPTSTNKYTTAKGTSFSAPVVSGIAALLKSADESLTQEDLFEIVEKVSVDLGETGYDNYYGYGMADAKAYLNYQIAEAGDVNADGKLAENDAYLIINQLAKKKNATPFVKETVADVDADGIVTLKDAFIVIKNINEK